MIVPLHTIYFAADNTSSFHFQQMGRFYFFKRRKIFIGNLVKSFSIDTNMLYTHARRTK